MAAYVYDANEVNTNIDGKIVTGYSEGTMVSCSKDEEKFSTKVSAKGDVSVATKNNPLGTITLTLSMGSPFVPYLNKLANTAQTFPIWVTGGQEKSVAQKRWSKSLLMLNSVTRLEIVSSRFKSLTIQYWNSN